MKDRVRHYFACGHTARGFYNLLDSNLDGIRALFVLEGSPKTVITSMLRETGEFWEKKVGAVEYLHSPTDNTGLNGVIVPGLTGVIDALSFPSNDCVQSLSNKTVISLKDAFAFPSTSSQIKETRQINEEIRNELARVHQELAEALEIHNDWEAIYIRRLNFESANRVAEDLIHGFYGNKSMAKMPVVKHRFLGGSTPKGAVDYIPNLTDGLSKRFLLKGRPGTGKSTMLNKLALEGQKRGFNVEIYHCGFDPLSLDMIIVRELGMVVFDSTAPHEYFPSRDGDEIVDVYAMAVKENTDKIYADELWWIEKRYKEKTEKATSHLVRVKSLNDMLCAFYMNSVDRNHLNSARARLIRGMEALVSESMLAK